MTFKYHEFHKTLSCDCPDTEKLKPVIKTAFRFSHENLKHPNNFLPPFLINKSQAEGNCNILCSGYALSFFNSLAEAEKKYIKIASGHAPMFIPTVGEFIAEWNIREDDGIANKANKSGHFDLHEFQGTDYTGRLKLIKKIQL